MVKRISLLALVIVGLALICTRRSEIVGEHFTSWPEEEDTWASLKHDLAGNRFWKAWQYSGKRVAFSGQPVFDPHHNPMLVSIWRTPIWCHLQLRPDEFKQIHDRSKQSDTITVGVLGRVEGINWYTKHITIASLESRVDAAQ